MSTHIVEVIPVRLEKHPNADSLSIVRVREYACVVRTNDWQDGDLAAYVEPDYVVPADRQEFAFLGPMGAKVIDNNGVHGYRIKVKRLRGVMSMGLLVKAPTDSEIGDNVIDRFGVTRYEPPVTISGGEACPPPPGIRHCYDVESAYRYAHLFQEGEGVVASEKVHGSSARYTFVPGDGPDGGTFHCGSRNEWKRQEATNLWWRALEKTEGLKEFLMAHPDLTIYGEVYGQVQDLKYGLGRGEPRFVAFDLLRSGAWLGYEEARGLYPAHLPWVPIVYRGPYSKDAIFSLADGPSLLSTVPQIREGIVVRPVVERTSLEIGRVQLKIVSNAYLERA